MRENWAEIFYDAWRDKVDPNALTWLELTHEERARWINFVRVAFLEIRRRFYVDAK